MENIEMLRWVLAGIGIFLVALLYWFGRADKRNYRKRANYTGLNKPVEPYLSSNELTKDELTLELDAAQRAEISREIQASPVADNVFETVDKFYEEVVDAEESHEDAIVVPDLPSFSAHSVSTQNTNIEQASSDDASVPAWLQNGEQEKDQGSASPQHLKENKLNTVGLFKSDSRNPDKSPSLPIENAVSVKSSAPDTKAMPENYGDKIKQAMAAVTNIEKSKEESVPEHRNLFDKLPRPAEHGKNRDSGLQEANVFENKVTEEIIEENIEAESRLEEPVEEKVVEQEPVVEAEQEPEQVQAEQEVQDVTLQTVELVADSEAIIDQAAKSSTSGGKAAFYATSETKSNVHSKERVETEPEPEPESNPELSPADDTVIRIDPSRFRRSNSNGDAEQKNPDSSIGNSAAVQVVSTKEEAVIEKIETDEPEKEEMKLESKPEPSNQEPNNQEQDNAVQENANQTTDEEPIVTTKTRVSGFDRDNPDADLITFYLINKDKHYSLDAVKSLAFSHGLILNNDNILYMAQDTGYAKDDVFCLRAVDEGVDFSKADNHNEHSSTIAFKLLQGKDIMGRINTMDSMLRLSKTIETQLGGSLYDVGYCPITDLMISHLRRQIQESDTKNL